MYRYLTVLLSDLEVVEAEQRAIDGWQLPEQNRNFLWQLKPRAGVDHDPPVHLFEGGDVGVAVYEDGYVWIVLEHFSGSLKIWSIRLFCGRFGLENVVPLEGLAHISVENP